MIAIERLRALEKKYETRLENWTRLHAQDQQNDADGRWNRAHMLQCQDILDDLRTLIAELGQEVGAVGDGTCYDRGPWRWERTGSKVDVFSDDFTCDVALRIDGDFATDDVADSYAKWLADTLNGHITSPAHTSEARDAVMTGAGDSDDLPAFLEWVAGEVVRRDTRAGNFAEGLAQSLRGRAHILRIVKKDAAMRQEAE